MKTILKKMFRPEKLSIYEEEKVQSPFRTVMRNFFKKKLTIFGLSVLAFILLTVLILPIFWPIDRQFSDATQVNISPGFRFRRIPREVQGNVKMFDAGNNFGIGVTNDNEIFVWGDYPSEIRDNIPEDMGNIIQVSTGLDHVLVLNDEGDVFSWGRDILRLGYLEIPASVASVNVVQIEASDQISLAIDDAGNLHAWGNQNIIRVRATTGLVTRSGEVVAEPIAGYIAEMAASNAIVLVRLYDGTVALATPPAYQGFLRYIPEEVQGRAVSIGQSDDAAAVILDDGTVVVWGLPRNNIREVPPHIQGRVVQVDGGRGHLSALLTDGTVYSWGWNNFNQANAPNLSGITYISAGYFNTFALDEDGYIHSWGLNGFLLGTDDRGRDTFSRLVTGGRISISVGVVAVIISSVIGIILGTISGYFSGYVDIVIMRIAEVWGSIPLLPIAIIFASLFFTGWSETARILGIMVIIGLLGWPPMARLARGQMLAARENEYVTAARAMGVKTKTIMFRHVFPNVLTVVAVSMALSLATSVLTESALSFIGIGVVEPTPTWGNMLTRVTESAARVRNFWWQWVFPSLYISLTCISMNLIGDGLREAIDPKANER